MREENLTQEQAIHLLERSMLDENDELSGLHGWTFPIMQFQLIQAHIQIHGSELPCTWTARHDLMRFTCPHGYFVAMYGLHNMIGSSRN